MSMELTNSSPKAFENIFFEIVGYLIEKFIEVGISESILTDQ